MRTRSKSSTRAGPGIVLPQVPRGSSPARASPGGDRLLGDIPRLRPVQRDRREPRVAPAELDAVQAVAPAEIEEPPRAGGIWTRPTISGAPRRATARSRHVAVPAAGVGVEPFRRPADRLARPQGALEEVPALLHPLEKLKEVGNALGESASSHLVVAAVLRKRPPRTWTYPRASSSSRRSRTPRTSAPRRCASSSGRSGPRASASNRPTAGRPGCPWRRTVRTGRRSAPGRGCRRERSASRWRSAAEARRHPPRLRALPCRAGPIDAANHPDMLEADVERRSGAPAGHRVSVRRLR